MKIIYLLFSLLAYAQAFSTTNIQLLYGNFNDNSYLYDTKSGPKTTVTLEHFRTWDYGDFFFFADYAAASDRFKYQDKKNDLYAEAAPRISFNKLGLCGSSFLSLKDIYFAFQINIGDDYEAYLGGIGVDIDTEFFDILSANIYHKEQSVGGKTVQLSLNYAVYDILNTPFTFEGFTDWTDNDLLTQNQLLYSLERFFNLKNEKLYFGTEWHYYTLKNSDVRSNTFQIMMKYRW